MSRVIIIFDAACTLFFEKHQSVFARADVRKQLGISSHDWDMGYTAIFQGMIEDCPEKSNKVLSKYRGIFKRVERGTYTLTKYGISLYKRVIL